MGEHALKLNAGTDAEPLLLTTPIERPNPAAMLARLAALHDETAETARLANVLGRTPWLAFALLAITAVIVVAASTSTVEPAPFVWGAFAAGSSLLLLRLYRHSRRSPFELLALRTFDRELRATLLFAGFVWGAGALLAMPSDNLLTILAFSAGSSLLAEGILRSPRAAHLFVVPATLLTAATLALGSLGADSACLAVAAGALVMAVADLAHRLREKPAFFRLVTLS